MMLKWCHCKWKVPTDNKQAAQKQANKQKINDRKRSNTSKKMRYQQIKDNPKRSNYYEMEMYGKVQNRLILLPELFQVFEVVKVE